MPSILNTQAAREHGPTLERNIRTLKDRTRSMVHLVPYRKITLLVIYSIVRQAKSMMNAFPSKKVISTTMSSRSIIEGRQNLFYNTMSLKLGAYIQLFQGAKNTQHSRSVGAIELNPLNKKGGYYFNSLRT